MKATRIHNRTRLIGLAILALIFIARLVLGLSLIQNQEIALMPDSASYMEVAAYWDQNNLFQSSGTDADLMRTPGYPLLLWLVMQFPVDLITMTIVLQLFMGGLVAVLIFGLIRTQFDDRAAIVGALLVLLSPNLFLWSLTILTDVVFTLLLILSVSYMQKLTRSPSSIRALSSGLALGAAALVRPIGLLLIPAWGLVVFMTGALEPSWKARLRLAVVTMLGALILVAPWIIRNAIVWDQATLSPISTWNLGQYQAAGALARSEGISIEEARTRFTITRPPVSGDGARYAQIILDHLNDYLVIHMQGTKTILIEANRPFFDRLVGERYRGSGVFSALSRLRLNEAADQLRTLQGNPNQRQLFWLNAGAQVGLAIVYLLSLAGLITSLRRRNLQVRLLLILMGVCFVLLILTPGPVGNDRFRVPLEPFIALLAAVGFSQVIGAVEQRIKSRTGAEAEKRALAD